MDPALSPTPDAAGPAVSDHAAAVSPEPGAPDVAALADEGTAPGGGAPAPIERTPPAEEADERQAVGSGGDPTDDVADAADPAEPTQPEEPAEETAALEAVVAVVVTRDPGPWFEDTLASLGAQDHPGLSVLVIDDGSVVPVTERVAAVLPGAFVRRLDDTVGYGAAANEVLGMVEGAGAYLLCHDDVALAPDAVRLLVAQAERTGASLVGPKLVDWDDHDRLLSVGLQVDRAGTASPVTDPNELDQGQHDIGRDVTALSGAVLLVRSAAFRSLQGFDVQITRPLGHAVDAGPDVGEDVDLCWRARMLGLRIVTEPTARVAHRVAIHGVTAHDTTDAGADQLTPREALSLARERARLRSVLVTSSGARLPAVLPVLAVQRVWHLVTGRRSVGHAVRVGRLADLRRLEARRRVVQSARTVADRQVLAPMLPVGSRTRSRVRADVQADGARIWNLAERTLALRGRGLRVVVGVIGLLVAAITFGSRNLVAGHVSAVGQLAPIPSPGTLWSLFRSGWSEAGVGVGVASPPGWFVLSLLGSVLLGATWLLRLLLTVGMLPFGMWGVWRLAADLAADPALRRDPVSAARARRTAQLAATFAYGTVPLPFDSLATGRLDALLAYGTLPWIIRLLVRATPSLLASPGAGDAADTSDAAASEATPPARWSRAWLRSLAGSTSLVSLLRLGVPVAVVAAIAPATAFGFGLAGVGLALGAALEGTRRAVRSVLGRAGAALLTAFVLLFPWSLQLLVPGAGLETITGGDQTRVLGASLVDILRLRTVRGNEGPIAAVLDLALVLSALLPLVIADGPRHRWAVRAWGMAIVPVVVTWLGGRGWLGHLAPVPGVALAPAGIGFALAAGLGIAAFVVDVRSRSFGWRQWLAGISLLSLAVASIPVVGASVTGRWDQPGRDLRSSLSWLDGQTAEGGFRTLWIGSPTVLPVAGWRVDDDLAVGASQDGLPDATDLSLTRRTAGVQLLVQGIDRLRSGGTSRYGRLLSETGVRYVVLLDRAAPGAPVHRAPRDVRDALVAQLDLREIAVEPGITVFENLAWVPVVAAVAARPSDVGSLDLTGAQALPATGRHTLSFVAPSLLVGATVHLAVPFDDDWSLHTSRGSRKAVRTGAVGMAFVPSARTPEGTDAVVKAELRHDPSTLQDLVVLLQLLGWSAVALRLFRTRVRARVAHEALLLAGERLEEAEEEAEGGEDERVGDVFRTDFSAPFGDHDDLAAAFDGPMTVGVRRAAAPSPGGVPVHTSAVAEADEASVEGGSADELWAEWSRRQNRRVGARSRSGWARATERRAAQDGWVGARPTDDEPDPEPGASGTPGSTRDASTGRDRPRRGRR